MEKTIEKYAMEADLSNIQPFERLRSLLGFYTSESSRALIDAGLYRAERKRLQRAIDDRTASLMASTKVATAWRAKALVRDDKKIQRWYESIEICDNVIEILDRLVKTYDGYVNALSREQTARQNDRDKYYGRGGAATP